MSAGYDQDKTEPATPKKRQDARKKGQVALTREIPTVMILFSGLIFFMWAGSWFFDNLVAFTREQFQALANLDLNTSNTTTLLWNIFYRVVPLILPLMLAVAIAGVIGNVAQVGFLITGESLTPKLDKLNPLNGIKRLFSIRSLAELVKSILKVIIIGTVGALALRAFVDQVPALVLLDVGGFLGFIGRGAFRLCLYTGLVLIVLAAADYVFQRWQHERDLRMTKQEVKDEYKQREGDPMVKSRIRSAQREMAMRRMMAAAAEATVVITNPTHLAVALKYDGRLPAPQVVAKGAGHVAERIKAVARENNVPVVEQKPLARALFAMVEIDQYIPAELYRAVAEVLAYVYRLRQVSSPDTANI